MNWMGDVVALVDELEYAVVGHKRLIQRKRKRKGANSVDSLSNSFLVGIYAYVGIRLITRGEI